MHISHLIHNWKVTNKILASDHRCITFHIKTDKVEQAKFRNVTCTDWNKFNEHLSRHLPPLSAIDSTSQLDESASALTNALIQSFETACPERTIKPGRAAEFFTSEIRKLRKELRKAFNRAKQSPANAERRRQL